MDKIYNVGIIGGGISGVLTAAQLADLGIKSVLFEQENSVVSGPPFCHLHAGGNLYPDISEEQCKVLMKQSIDIARLLPQSIDERPTFISIPQSEKGEVSKIVLRLKMLVAYYKQLISEDPSNETIGSPDDYYKTYSKEDIIALSAHPTVERPESPDEWMINALKVIDYDSLKMPLILVQEYGWNLFRTGAQAQLALKKTDKCLLQLNTKVKAVKDVRHEKKDYNWEIYTKDSVYKVNYLVNSCGFKTGEFDESLHLKVERLIEFKAAYVSKWHSLPGLLPELIFHGERGTPQGMAQLTPYCEDYYQIHGMTQDITLFQNGLVRAKENEAQPDFNDEITQKLNRRWKEEEVNSRTQKAIDFVAKFVPTFKSATLGGPPLYGAQQIPGDDPSLRVGEVSFPYASYARSEIVKASSALMVAHQIITKIKAERTITVPAHKGNKNSLLDSITKKDIDTLASELAAQRGYPRALSRLLIDKKEG